MTDETHLQNNLESRLVIIHFYLFLYYLIYNRIGQ